MIFIIFACMSSKINKLEQDILEYQTQNSVLEARITKLESDIEEFGEPIEQLKMILDANKYLATTVSPPHSVSITGQVDPKWADQVIAWSNNAPVSDITISKAQMDILSQDAESLSRMLRIVPHRSSEGYIDGYRLSGIRRASLPAQLGLKNGDILMAINGKMVYPMSESMNRYQEIQDNSFTVLIKRRQEYIILSFSQEK